MSGSVTLGPAWYASSLSTWGRWGAYSYPVPALSWGGGVHPMFWLAMSFSAFRCRVMKPGSPTL